MLSEEEIVEIMENDLGLDTKPVAGHRGTNLMFCCPYHGESNPSAGLLVDGANAYGQCFACGEKFTLEKLYADMLGISFGRAVDAISDKFNAVKRDKILNAHKVQDYDNLVHHKQEEGKPFVLPMSYIAPFKSGKVAHKYLLERGFTKQTIKDCLIGWDKVRKRITVPVFHEDGLLLGVIGRAVIGNDKSAAYKKVYGEAPKYLVYEKFPIAQALFGCHEFPQGEKTALIVEGTLDRVWMRQLGFLNAMSIIVAKMGKDRRTGRSFQAEILQRLGVTHVVFMHDDDDAGREGKALAYEYLKHDFVCYDTQFPEGFKDPVGMTREQVEDMIARKTLYGRKKLRRL